MSSRRSLLIASGALAGALVCGVAGFVSGQDKNPEAPSKETAPAPTKPESEKDLSAAIDRETAKVWQRDNIKPAKEAGDEEFVRRVYFDLTGLPPSRDEAVAFIDSKEKDKREKLIAKLIDDKRFGEHLGDLWSNILLGRGGQGQGDRGGSTTLFGIWMAERINDNAKFSDIIYEIITAQGLMSENPAVAPFVRERPFKVANAAGLLTKNLTGIQIQCAECHDHPYEKDWKQSTFTGVASFYSPINQQINPRNVPNDPRIEDNARAVRVPPNMGNLPAEARQRLEDMARFNKPVTLDGKAIKTPDRGFWRAYLAKWTIGKENKQTGRYIANRVWSFAMGIGLHQPVDDFNSMNTASHPELLDALGQDLIDHNYDIKRLYRSILNSGTYQLSGKGGPDKAQDWHFASAASRQLSAEQFFGALVTISGGDDLARMFRNRADPIAVMRRNYEQRAKQTEKGENKRDYEFDEDALKRLEGWYKKMSDGWYMRRTLAAGFTSQSSDDEMTEADAFSLTIDQALAVMNGDVVNRIAGSGRGTIANELVQRVKGDEARIETLFLTVLSRKPTNAEKSRLETYVRGQKDAAAAYEDVLFALLAGSEFATNH